MNRYYQRLLSLLCVLFLVGNTRADDAAVIEELVKPLLKDKPYQGIIVGITKPTGSRSMGFGNVAREGTDAVAIEDVVFEIGSISKTFTGILLAEQVLAKKLRLDDPVQKHLPAALVLPQRDQRDITFLHLATHTSSLPVQPPTIALFAASTKNPANPYAEYDQNQLRQTLTNLKLARPIGSEVEYSNLGVGLLGHALVAITKSKNYEALLIERLVKPLELRDTCVTLTAEQRQRLAIGHNRMGKPTSEWTFASLEGCGCIRSTSHDLLRFIEANVGRRPNPLGDALALAQQPWRETGRIKGEHVGLCWFRQKGAKENRTMVWHNGGTGGYRSFLAFIPETGVGVVVLGNSPQSLDALGQAILKHLDTPATK